MAKVLCSSTANSFSDKGMPGSNKNGNTVSGACLCGSVRFVVDGDLRGIVFCHCSQCRRVQGSFAAYTAAASRTIELTHRKSLRWFASSVHARRGFCSVCGSSLFWVPEDSSYWAISAGSIEPRFRLTALRHVFVADKAAYYEILDNLPQCLGSQRN